MEQQGAEDLVGGPTPAAPSPMIDPLDEWDAPAEVEATFRTQRRVAVGYFLVFLVVTFTVPVLSVTWSWWTGASLVGGMSPSFLMAAAGLYAFFLVLGLLAASLADTVEQRMLGSEASPDDVP